MSNSTFYRDGYRAGCRGDYCSPPDALPYHTEYCDGYRDAMLSLEPIAGHEGANDMHSDYHHA